MVKNRTILRVFSVNSDHLSLTILMQIDSPLTTILFCIGAHL